MPITPVRDLLYILPFEETSDIGLIAPSDAHHKEKRSTQGIVKYRGPWTTGEVKVGDHVIYPGYSGDTLVIEGEGLMDLNYLLAPEQVRLAVKRAGVEIAQIEEGTKEKIMAIRIADRMVDHLTTRFLEELYF
ncbi:hypothetical protein LCGC14_2102650 [marine sediment metagenome]|uniref:10 kDa chaperonin n=1 Tax=marine sediment metagenome TaxID=412755 RepID=A0A0F9H5V9_9ZZZZ